MASAGGSAGKAGGRSGAASLAAAPSAAAGSADKPSVPRPRHNEPHAAALAPAAEEGGQSEKTLLERASKLAAQIAALTVSEKALRDELAERSLSKRLTADLAASNSRCAELEAQVATACSVETEHLQERLWNQDQEAQAHAAQIAEREQELHAVKAHAAAAVAKAEEQERKLEAAAVTLQERDQALAVKAAQLREREEQLASLKQQMQEWPPPPHLAPMALARPQDESLNYPPQLTAMFRNEGSPMLPQQGVPPFYPQGVHGMLAPLMSPHQLPWAHQMGGPPPSGLFAMPSSEPFQSVSFGDFTEPAPPQSLWPPFPSRPPVPVAAVGAPAELQPFETSAAQHSAAAALALAEPLQQLITPLPPRVRPAAQPRAATSSTARAEGAGHGAGPGPGAGAGPGPFGESFSTAPAGRGGAKPRSGGSGGGSKEPRAPGRARAQGREKQANGSAPPQPSVVTPPPVNINLF